MTEEIFRSHPYKQKCDAIITAVHTGAVELDRTVFYPMGGGQPGDLGALKLASGVSLLVTDTRRGSEAGQILHLIEDATDMLIGMKVTACICWPRRHRLMRMHTCLHLLSAVIAAGVTGGSVRDGSGRLDFDLPESNLDKESLTRDLNRLISDDHRVVTRWITDEELDTQPELVKTMSVKPPRGHGWIRLLEIEGVDLQPCGGTHVAGTKEIGHVRVSKIEKKGKHNRRVTVELEEE